MERPRKRPEGKEWGESIYFFDSPLTACIVCILLRARIAVRWPSLGLWSLFLVLSTKKRQGLPTTANLGVLKTLSWGPSTLLIFCKQFLIKCSPITYSEFAIFFLAWTLAETHLFSPCVLSHTPGIALCIWIHPLQKGNRLLVVECAMRRPEKFSAPKDHLCCSSIVCKIDTFQVFFF